MQLLPTFFFVFCRKIGKAENPDIVILLDKNTFDYILIKKYKLIPNAHVFLSDKTEFKAGSLGFSPEHLLMLISIPSSMVIAERF